MSRSKPKRDPEREERITREIVVDCYDRHERAMGWYYYLEDQLRFPVTATCIAQRAVSPLRVKDEVEVLGMAPEDECECEVFVMMRWDRAEGLGVPLAQLKPISHSDEQTKQAVADWHYWREHGVRLLTAERENLLPEYRFDYGKAKPNRFAGRRQRGTRAVVLDPDVAAVFSTGESVNAVLRALIETMPQKRSGKRTNGASPE